MRELTKKQKLKVLDVMIKKVNVFDGLCWVYYAAVRELNYKQYATDSRTPRFRELATKIGTEITRTDGSAFIHYGMNKDKSFNNTKWKSDRLKLLKNLRKEIGNDEA